MLCQMAMKRLDYAGAVVARFLGVTTSLVSRLASTEEVARVDRYVR